MSLPFVSHLLTCVDFSPLLLGGKFSCHGKARTTEPRYGTRDVQPTPKESLTNIALHLSWVCSNHPRVKTQRGRYNPQTSLLILPRLLPQLIYLRSSAHYHSTVSYFPFTLLIYLYYPLSLVISYVVTVYCLLKSLYFYIALELGTTNELCLHVISCSK